LGGAPQHQLFGRRTCFQGDRPTQRHGEANQICGANALFYIGWNDWKSTRELELSLRKAVTNVGSDEDTLRLSDFRPSQAALDAVEEPSGTLLEELEALL
jgi:hypothetical protein